MTTFDKQISRLTSKTIVKHLVDKFFTEANAAEKIIKLIMQPNIKKNSKLKRNSGKSSKRSAVFFGLKSEGNKI